MTKKALIAAALCAALIATTAATAEWQWPWKRAPKTADVSLGAVVSQVIGGNDMVTIADHRPGVKGRQVWKDKSDNPNIGPLVPHDGNPRPWRAGANECTNIEFTSDVLINGEPLAKGKYGLFMIPTDGDWTIIFNSNSSQWGSFTYDQSKDVLRVTATPEEAPHQEWLTYGFDELQGDSVRAYLHWEKKKIPFTIKLAPKE
jgi:hypothetical protein